MGEGLNDDHERKHGAVGEFRSGYDEEVSVEQRSGNLIRAPCSSWQSERQPQTGSGGSGGSDGQRAKAAAGTVDDDERG